MQLFKDNDFPQRLYRNRPEDLNGAYVYNKKELAEKIAEGWQQSPIGFEYPKWVGPHDEQSSVQKQDGTGKAYFEPILIQHGGKVCQNAQEEKDHLEYLASMGDADTAADLADGYAGAPKSAARRGRKPGSKNKPVEELAAV